MKNNKTVENIAYGALILNIVRLLTVIGLLYVMPVVNALANLGIPPEVFAPLQLARIFSIIAVVLQASMLVYKIQSNEKICPKCQTPLPKWHIPKNGYELFVGGWTCSSCGTKLTWQLHERE